MKVKIEKKVCLNKKNYGKMYRIDLMKNLTT